MRTIAVGIFVITGAALFAQTSGNVIFTAQGGGIGGPIGLPGPQTFAFVAGELSGNTVKGAPYSAQASTQTTQTLADGNQIVNNNTATVYRDAEGRERREQSLPNIGPFAAQNATPAQTVFFYFRPGRRRKLFAESGGAHRHQTAHPVVPAAGRHRQWQSCHQATIRVGNLGGPAPGRPGTGLRPHRSASTTASGPPPNPPAVEQLGTQSIQGLQATGTRTTITIPAGQMGNSLPIQIVDEVWRSPDLQVIVQSTHSDPRMGTTVYTLNNVSRTDPSPTLFQVPADYTIKDAPAIIRKSDGPVQLP